MAPSTETIGEHTYHLRRNGTQLRFGPAIVPAPYSHSPTAILPWLTENLTSRPVDAPYARILIDDALPNEWHRQTWEHHPLGASFLGEKAQVIRRYRINPLTITGQRSLMLDRWPDERFVSAVQSHVEHRALDIRRGTCIDAWLAANQDLTAYRELIVVAHGSTCRSGLLTEAGTSWALRLPPRLPPLVWFFSCEEKEGYLEHLISTAFAQGAQCIACADGKLAASHITSLITAWLSLRHKPPSPADWLYDLQQRETRTGSANAIQIHGAIHPSWQQGRAQADA